MRKFIPIILIAMAMPAAAEVSAEDMLRVRNQLLQGNAEAAIDLLHEMQVEAPDSPFVQFGLGEAYSMAADQVAGTGDLEGAVAFLHGAQRAFEAAGEANAPSTLTANAHYNAANTMTRMGELMVEGEQYHGAVNQLQNALESYEIALSRDPEHPHARHNRAYTRWALKQLLMEDLPPPPPPEEQPQPQPEGDDDEQEGEEDEDQDQEPGEDEEQPEQPEGEEEQPEGEDPEDSEDQSGEPEAGEFPQPEPQQQPQDDPQEPEDMPMQEFEALLDNLMDIDDEEQRNLRREQRSQQAIREWW